MAQLVKARSTIDWDLLHELEQNYGEKLDVPKDSPDQAKLELLREKINPRPDCTGQLIDLVNEGYSVQEIVDKVHRSRNWVRQNAKKNNLKFWPRFAYLAIDENGERFYLTTMKQLKALGAPYAESMQQAKLQLGRKKCKFYQTRKRIGELKIGDHYMLPGDYDTVYTK